MRTNPLVILFVFAIISFQTPLPGQALKEDSTRVYRVNPWVSGGIGVAGLVATRLGRNYINDRKPPLTAEELAALSAGQVNAFDRVALRQPLDRVPAAETASDIGLLFGTLAPAILYVDPRIRSHGLEYGLLYLETISLNAFFHTWSPIGPQVVDRIRPRAYYSELPVSERNDQRLRNSFFSGHTAGTAAGAFFAAKVLWDYHPEWGGKRWIFFGLAAIPPTLVGLWRVQGIRHFPTDVIAGGIIGGAIGVLVPHLHKIKRGKVKLSFRYDDYMKGGGMVWRF